MATNERPTLGNFMSLTCFQYLRVGTEEVADRAPIVAAGRKRGYDVIESLHMLGASEDPALIHSKLEEALGAKGTRLCIVKSIVQKSKGSYEVRITEGACSAGQVSNTPICAFTLGVFIGALHAFTGIPMRGFETACVASGAKECVYNIEAVAF